MSAAPALKCHSHSMHRCVWFGKSCSYQGCCMPPYRINVSAQPRHQLSSGYRHSTSHVAPDEVFAARRLVRQLQNESGKPLELTSQRLSTANSTDGGATRASFPWIRTQFRWSNHLQSDAPKADITLNPRRPTGENPGAGGPWSALSPTNYWIWHPTCIGVKYDMEGGRL